MTVPLRAPRLLEKSFEEELSDGILTPLLRLIQRDRDLIAEIRSNALDIYCKGQVLARVEPAQGLSYCIVSHEKFWKIGRQTVSAEQDVRDFCAQTVPFIKQLIAEHGARGKEIEFEQLLVRANNLESLNTDYIAVDRQGVIDQGRGRTDVVGVYWPSERRGSTNALAPALIEVKYGLRGGVEDVAEQMGRYFDDMRVSLPMFAKELEKQLHQKARLGLLAGLSEGAQQKIQKLSVSERIEDVRAVIALVDYNPRARRLDLEKLRKLPFADQIDLFHLGFGLWRGNSCFHHATPSTEGWIERVRSGDFAAIPQPFTWDRSAELAHLIDGYKAAEQIGLGQLGPFANMKLSLHEATGRWDGSATELWLCLFYEHRRARHSDEPEEHGDGTAKLDKLCAVLREKLQVIKAKERNLVLNWLSRGFGSPSDLE